MTADGAARVAELCQQARLGNLEPAVAILLEHQRHLKRPGITALAAAISERAAGRATHHSSTVKRIQGLVWMMGVLQVEEAAARSPLTSAEWKHAEFACSERLTNELIPLLNRLAAFTPAERATGVDSGARELYVREADFALAYLAAADSTAALRRIYGNLYGDMCQEVGWEVPAELLDVEAWKRICLAIIEEPATSLATVRFIVSRELDELDTRWVAANRPT